VTVRRVRTNRRSPVGLPAAATAMESRRGGPDAGVPEPNNQNLASVDLAWRTHGAQEAWTQKVDLKTAVVLALEGGALFAVLASHTQTGLLAHNTHLGHIAELVGLVLLLAAVLTAVWALTPRLGSTLDHRAHYREHTIYFGHLRHWAPDDLADSLRHAAARDPFPMLARQLIEMSRRNWTKHRKLQWSLGLGAGGLLALTGAAILAVLTAAP